MSAPSAPRGWAVWAGRVFAIAAAAAFIVLMLFAAAAIGWSVAA